MTNRIVAAAHDLRVALDQFDRAVTLDQMAQRPTSPGTLSALRHVERCTAILAMRERDAALPPS